MSNQPTSLMGGRFLLQSPLGEGGMARVYRAYDRRLQVWRAAKVLLPKYAQHRKLRQRFESEAQAMALLEHPNIVRVYDVGTEGDVTWIIMELCDGGAVDEWLVRHGKMPPRMAVSVALQVCAGIGMAHDQNVVHRDIKPQNVLISRKGICKVTDFGIAQLERTTLTQTGTVMGTLGFMAPEQRSNAKAVDMRADIYSVGATLFNLITGHIHLDLHAADRDGAILRGFPAPLVPLMLRATAYDRQQRYAHVDDLAEALRQAREHLPEDPGDTPPLVRSGLQRPSPPSLVEQAMAEAADDSAPLPGETLLPADLPSDTDIPASLRPDEVTTDRPRRTYNRGIQPPPRPPKGPATDSFMTTTPEMFDRDTEQMTPEQKERIAALPWVPAAERRAPSGSDDSTDEVDFQSLYHEPEPRPPPSHSHVDIGLEADEKTWDEHAKDTSTPADDETGEAPLDDTARGAAWAAKEILHFVSQIVSGIISFLSTPVQYVLWPTVAILLVGSISSMNGANNVDGAQEDTESSWRLLSATLDRDAEEIVTELQEVGATTPVLDAKLEAYRNASTEEERREAARELAAVVAEQYRSLDEATDPAVKHRRKVLGAKVEMLSRQATQYHEAEEQWRAAAQSNSGRLAVTLGMAERPPAQRE